ncbi:hypothetical protein M9H77_28449 [Catharanthus roseus]|uniref:Uncharacterized protein n=1 Tax=Catharanthus roseus TaxID=4058 RepID=A0ACC0AJI5_CATRO|nr:hypothetical protein M9H77_28449 [Catharanthus roseus]
MDGSVFGELRCRRGSNASCGRKSGEEEKFSGWNDGGAAPNWQSPPPPLVKVNTYGSFWNGRGGAAAVVQDGKGGVVVAVAAMPLQGLANSVMAVVLGVEYTNVVSLLKTQGNNLSSLGAYFWDKVNGTW